MVSQFLWMTASPDLTALRARLPPWPNPQPTNDSAELVESLNWPLPADSPAAERDGLGRMTLVYNGDTQLKSEEEREAEEKQEMERQLDTLLQLTRYDEVFSPPRADPLSFPALQNFRSAVEEQIRRAEVGLETGNREDLGKLIDIYAMLHHWRHNLWSDIPIIVVTGASSQITDHLTLLFEENRLNRAETERIHSILVDRCPIMELTQMCFIAETHKGMYQAEMIRSSLNANSFLRRQWIRCWFNPDIMEKEVLSANIPIIEAIGEGRYDDANRLVEELRTRLRRSPFLHTRNWGGYALLPLLISNMGVLGESFDTDEDALCELASGKPVDAANGDPIITTE